MEITTAAYNDLKNYVQNNWKYIELQTPAGEQILRLDATDERVTITQSNDTVVYEVTLRGSDSDISLPTTVNHTAIFKTVDSADVLSHETVASFTFENVEDELKVVHTIQVPQEV